jgi:hypothetical protein
MSDVRGRINRRMRTLLAPAGIAQVHPEDDTDDAVVRRELRIDLAGQCLSIDRAAASPLCGRRLRMSIEGLDALRADS